MEWVEKLDESTKEHLKLQIKETHINQEALKSSKDPLIAQLWIAIANLSKQLNDITIKLDYLEGALQKLHKENMKTTSKEENIEIKKAMEKIMRGKSKKSK
ncbi:hypothetical protein HYX18_00850 [Candidatus Woesearchaeota archaeon]|nr:hypothetical protein [Candidatus Woesearchaeota archaeon]